MLSEAFRPCGPSRAERNGCELEIRIKTGFYATEPYELTVENGIITMTPKLSSGISRISVTEDELFSLSISIKKRKHPYFELSSKNGDYEGHFCTARGLDRLIGNLRRQFRQKILSDREEEKC